MITKVENLSEKELIRFAKQKADRLGVPLLFDTDMKDK